MSRRSHTWNAYESSLISSLLIGSTSVAVQSAIDLEPPLYLVVDPDDSAKREWIYVRTINGNNLENIVRNQDGSVGNVDHDAGAKIRAVFTKQLQDDIFEDIEDLEQTLLTHAQDHGDPHVNAGYLKEGDGDGRYVRLDGFTPMTGPLTLWGDPTADRHAAPKQYVDGQDHDHATPIAAHAAIADAHHARYTDAEAIAAVGTPWDGQYLPLHGTADAAKKWVTARTLTVELAGDLSGSANASLDGTANRTIKVTAVVANDSHTHDGRYYTETEANGRFAAKSHNHDSVYLKLAGGTITGSLTVNGRIMTHEGTVSAPGIVLIESGNDTGFYGNDSLQRVGVTIEGGAACDMVFAASSFTSLLSGKNLGASAYPWATVYSDNLAAGGKTISVEGVIDSVHALINYANAHGGSIPTLP